MSVLPYGFLVAILHHHKAHLFQSDVIIGLVLFQESMSNITPFLDPFVIQGHIPA
jgi:hypothetical protein